MNRATTCLFVGVLAIAVSGCNQKLYRAETSLRSDGSVSRSIYQLTEETPEAVRDSDRWQGKTHAERISLLDWKGKIAELPQAVADKDHPYFAAWGEFENVAALPDSVLIETPAGIAAGQLERDYDRSDFVLLSEHRWQETLTDVVTLDDMHQAREELAELMIPLTEQILQRTLGEAYDIQPLADWMRQVARPLFFEVTDAYFELRARRMPVNEQTIVAMLEPILQRHGISIRDESGALRDLVEVVRGHARQTLVDKIRRRDGQPIADSTVTEILQWAGFEPLPDNAEPPQQVERAARQVVVERFGSDKAMEAAFRPLLIRILGIYGSDLGPRRQFDYWHEMPGLLIETSGELISENVTRWRFVALDAFPFGYSMTCRSLEANETLQQSLLGKATLVDREAMLRYLDLVRNNEPLLAVLRICADEGDLRRLRREYQLLKEAGDRNASSFEKMLTLLDAE